VVKLTSKLTQKLTLESAIMVILLLMKLKLEEHFLFNMSLEKDKLLIYLFNIFTNRKNITNDFADDTIIRLKDVDLGYIDISLELFNNIYRQ
jgi:hypothetical protein